MGAPRTCCLSLLHLPPLASPRPHIPVHSVAPASMVGCSSPHQEGLPSRCAAQQTPIVWVHRTKGWGYQCPGPEVGAAPGLGTFPQLFFFILAPERPLSLSPTHPGSSTLSCPLLGRVKPYHMPCLPKFVCSRCSSIHPSYTGTPSLHPTHFRGHARTIRWQ